ncbi:MAG: integrin alpha, partial [Candidatus Thermoplasmatota archaeon]|nr:integrin alpha [Candidatus Thermoplasmatota archaeon]
EEIGGISLPTFSGDKFGYCLETVDDLNSDGYDEILVCSIDYELSSDTGKVELFSGGSSDGTWTKMDSPNQMLQGSNFGQSISADGDLNGDGLNDLVIGNTGTLQDSSGYSSVEVRYGSSTGFESTPDRSYQSISPGTLFGYQVQIINDLNNDGYDELFVSEPYNTSVSYNTGDVWVFYGNFSGVAATPEYRMNGDANDLLGLNFASAGDTNNDGFNDMFITRNGGFDQGKVELILGSGDLIDDTSYFVAGGTSSFGHAISNHGDSDGDGLSEFFFNSQSVDESQTVFLNLESYSRKLFDVSEVTISGESLDGKIQSSSNGNPRLIFDLYNATETTVQTQMLSLQSDSQSKSWIT